MPIEIIVTGIVNINVVVNRLPISVLILLLSLINNIFLDTRIILNLKNYLQTEK